MKFRTSGLRALIGSFFLIGAVANVSAEVNKIGIAQQYGISYLPLMIMEENKLLEKEAKEAGLGDIKVQWAKFAGGNVMNDALLSGDLQFASGGLGPFITLWAKTKDNIGVKAVAAMNSMPLFLNTRNPDIKTLKDFSSKDKIALPAVKVSIQAITLQMAAEKAFGPGKENQLDKFTVTQSHPDGMAALLSGSSEINSHFTSPPFQYIELDKPGIHTVVNSYEVTGGPHTFNVVWASQKFVDANPKTYAAFLKAFDSSIAIINKDKKAAAEFYIRVSKSKESVESIEKMLNDPDIEFTTTPKNTMKYADFMNRIGMVKTKPISWKEMFFPNMHALPGS
ncbi:ABC transporter substrate-binding protein [Herminiimonas contaminans]|uniref:ABC transporter substrate-binding protein n=1 Tax=Herminiimonas contaminans TaxID=1111140 RepID=A0ABS0ESW5_9BURK|nr:ABC transporter substrate-binding protein [Herminiimonas contaminans]MBF8177938.1 ABC transporter substrate-binding protein [Herminiimonas contaminans]